MHTPSPGLPDPPTRPATLPPPPPFEPPRTRRWVVVAVVLILTLTATAAAGLFSFARSPVDESRDFRFLQKLPNGMPYRWDPCQPIHWSVHLQYAPPGAQAIVEQAVARVANATGIRFIFDGPTDLNIGTYEARYFMPTDVTGSLWLPVLIDWLPHDQFTSQVGTADALAYGFPVDGQDTDLYTYRSGAIVIDAGRSMPVNFAERFSLGPVVMHEMAHVIGLGHVPEGDELMWSPQVPGATQFPDLSETGYGPGDLEGLHELGAGAPCGIVHYTPSPAAP